jgi:hypothetical protein
LKRSIMMVCAVVCILACCIPAFATGQNSVIITASDTGTVSSPLSKSITINATATYSTTGGTPNWTSITSVATVTLYYTVYNAAGTLIQSGAIAMTAGMVPNLPTLQYNGPTGPGQIQKRGAPFSVGLSITTVPGAAYCYMAAIVNVTATWHRTSGSPLTDTHVATSYVTNIY